jgi:peptidoglycan/LPS O-acetylase OafA/YrhL
MTATIAAPPATQAVEPPTPSRLAWLDALRGVAALVVAFHHASYRYVPDFDWRIQQWFDPGTYGVTLFFLVSGYIVPASLNRTGSVRTFWISRLFRIYPLWGFASALIVVLALTDVVGWRTNLYDVAPATAVVAHVTMLQDMLFVPSAIGVMWTLSYEMAFYLLVAALFTVRMHNRPGRVASGFAIGAVTLGSLLPVAGLSRVAGTDLVVGLTAAAVVAAICCAMSGPARVRTAGAVLGGVLSIVLVTVNGRVGPWQGLTILAVMFTGTLLYQAEHGQARRGTAALVAGAVLVCSVFAGVWHSRTWGLPAAAELAFQRGWTTAIVLAAATFAAGIAVRRAALPRWLTQLGVISYSIYLLHPVLFQTLDQIIGRPRNDNPVMLVAVMAGLVPVAWVAYRLVEAPTQRLGRRIGRRFKAQVSV